VAHRLQRPRVPAGSSVPQAGHVWARIGFLSRTAGALVVVPGGVGILGPIDIRTAYALV
jgi:hypothetical protein